MKLETLVLATASALALAHPSAAQVVLASAAVLATNRVEQRRKQHKRKTPRSEPER